MVAPSSQRSTFIAGLGFVPAAVEAACNVRNPTACTADSKPRAEAPQPQVQPPQPQTAAAAAKPLQLKRYIKLGPARRSVSRSGKRRTAHRSAHRKFSARNKRKTARASYKAQPKVSATASAEAGAAPLTPKVIPTIPISARALALAPTAKDHTVGFAAETTPWSGESAFASANERRSLAAGRDHRPVRRNQRDRPRRGRGASLRPSRQIRQSRGRIADDASERNARQRNPPLRSNRRRGCPGSMTRQSMASLPQRWRSARCSHDVSRRMHWWSGFDIRYHSRTEQDANVRPLGAPLGDKPSGGA